MDEVQEKLDTLALAISHKIEREWPPRFAHLPVFTPGFFGLSIRLARITFRTICYVNADVRLTEHDWRWYYTLSIPPLNRTILDSIFNVIFMLEDFEARSRWYFMSGFREAEREYQRYIKQYGPSADWQAWFSGKRAMLDQGETLLGVTQQEIADTKWWPNPGAMVIYGQDPSKLSADREFLQYLNDWFYRETAAQNHQSFFGLMSLGGLLTNDTPALTDEQKERVESEFYPKHRAIQVSRSTILLLSLVSEIEHFFNFGLAPTVVDLWTKIVKSGLPEGREIYEKRYANFWPVIGR